MTPFVSDPDFTLYVGDALEVLRGLPDESVHCCVTSPPYWGLRDYGTGAWAGGDPEHKHDTAPARGGRGGSGAPGKQTEGAFPSELAVDTCSCGATRTDQQLGLEATPDQYVARMVEVFREVRRVLRSDGTLWLNLGDSYVANSHGRNGDDANSTLSQYSKDRRPGDAKNENARATGLKSKDLVGIPWRVAFALQADGWYLRSDIIWAKPNPMPESVTDRPTKAHEYVFLLTKSPRYFFDQEAVRERATYYGPNGAYGSRPDSPHAGQMLSRAGKKMPPTWDERKAAGATRGNVAFDGNVGAGTQRGVHGEGVSHDLGDGHSRNLRSVWEIATQPYPEAHFATFPEALPDRCIRAGSSERGCCPECGAAWVRQVSTEYVKSPVHGAGSVVGRHEVTGANNFDGAGMPRLNKQVTTTGWAASCECFGHFETVHYDAVPSACLEAWDERVYVPDADAPEPIPATILDCFMGSGTTALVARKLGRRSIGIELSPEYAELCARRLQQQSLFAGDAA